MLQWVWQAAKGVALFDQVVFAVDCREIADLVSSFGGDYFLTSEACTCGTERLVELRQRGCVEADLWVNWQGDEPLISPLMIDQLLQTALSGDSDVWTLKKQIVHPEEISNAQIAKVVCDARGFALLFSRSPIPCDRDAEGTTKYYKHVGLYAFTSEALAKLYGVPPCDIEEAEKLEQLRFLYHGLKMRVHETQEHVVGVDLPEHLLAVEALVR